MRRITFITLSGLLMAVMILNLGVTPAYAILRAQADTETPPPTGTMTETLQPTDTPQPTDTATPKPTKTPRATATPPEDQGPNPGATSTATNTSEPSSRPLILASYSLPSKGVVPGKDFKLVLELYNQGSEKAYNVIVTIQGDKLIPRNNGGVQAIAELAAGGDKTIQQVLYATPELAGQETVSITVNVAYTDNAGTEYSTPLVILVNLKNPDATSSYSGPLLPTKTGTETPRSKLIIGGYKANIEKLQAGNLFKLNLGVQNLGNATAKDVTMVLGGATASGGGDGTPASGGGGVSGGGADLSKFAPLGSSNLYYLGDLAPGKSQEQTLDLVVNVATDPGVYPLKVSFVYENAQGERLIDDQVITMLVYALPQVTVSFYDTVGDISVGEFRPLPVQITNTGKKSTILGEVTIKASSGMLNKNTATVGTIDTGGYFTMDPEFIPETPGKVTLTIQIKYTDDFQQAGLIEKTLEVNVVEGFMPPPDGGGTDNGCNSAGGCPDGGGVMPPPEQPQESLMDSILKAIMGFFGLAGG